MVSGEEAVCIHPACYEVGILASLHTIMNISLPLSSLIAYLELKHSRHTRRREFTVQADNHETAFLRRMTPLCICIPIAKKNLPAHTDVAHLRSRMWDRQALLVAQRADIPQRGLHVPCRVDVCPC
jgi:hypothetical protein